MAGLKVKITGWKPINTKFDKAIRKYSEKGMNDVMKDLGTVSQSLAPVDTGDLERSMTTSVTTNGSYIIGSLRFEAYNQGFNYAVWTHDFVYNLGSGSMSKTPKPSKYGSYNGQVGTGYAFEPAQALAPDYAKHIADIISKAMN